MTVREILKEIEPIKPMTREGLYPYFKRLKIKPVGKVRQIPAQYPPDTARRILRELGLLNSKAWFRKERRAA